MLINLFIKSVNPLASAQYMRQTNPATIWKERLLLIRDFVTHRIQKTSPGNIQALYRRIHQEMRIFFQDLFQYALLTVSPHLDQQQWCLITAGSMGMEHGTPFSDLEFALLIKEESMQEAVYSWVTFVFLCVLNLREMPIRALNMKELNFLYGDYEHLMECGTRFDGGVARLYPLPVIDVCTSVGPFSLAQTPQKMVELVLAHARCKEHQLSYNFIYPSFFMGNETLYKQYRQLMQLRSFKETLGMESNLLRSVLKNQIESDLNNYPKLQEVYQFKREIYVVLHLFKTLKCIFNLEAGNHWDQLLELQNKKIISRTSYKELKNCIDWVQYHRLKLYTKNKGQHDQMPVLLEPSILDKYKNLPHVHYFLEDILGLFINYYTPALNLNLAIKSFLNNGLNKIPLSLSYPYESILPFVANYISRDNTILTQNNCHRLYEPIRDWLLYQKERIHFENNKLFLILSLRILTCVANCQMVSRSPIRAYFTITLCEDILKKGLNGNQKSLYTTWLNSSEPRIEIQCLLMLSLIESRLSTLVATMLYLKARCYFFGVSQVNFDESYSLALKACALRKWIDGHKTRCNDGWNEYGADSYIFKRTALLYHLSYRAKTEHDFLSIINEYIELLNIDDKKHQIGCHHRLLRIYTRLYLLTKNESYYNQGALHADKMNELLKDFSDLSNETKYLYSLNQLKKLKQTKMDRLCFFSPEMPRYIDDVSMDQDVVINSMRLETA